VEDFFIDPEYEEETTGTVLALSAGSPLGLGGDEHGEISGICVSPSNFRLVDPSCSAFDAWRGAGEGPMNGGMGAHGLRIDPENEEVKSAGPAAVLDRSFASGRAEPRKVVTPGVGSPLGLGNAERGRNHGATDGCHPLGRGSADGGLAEATNLEPECGLRPEPPTAEEAEGIGGSGEAPRPRASTARQLAAAVVLAKLEGDDLGKEDAEYDDLDPFYVCEAALEAVKRKLQRGERVAQHDVLGVVHPGGLADDELMVPVDLGAAEREYVDPEQMIELLGPQGAAAALVRAEQRFKKRKDSIPEDERPVPVTAREWRSILEEG